MRDTKIKIAKMKCQDGKTYLYAGSEDTIGEVIEESTMWCDPPVQLGNVDEIQVSIDKTSHESIETTDIDNDMTHRVIKIVKNTLDKK